MNDWLLQLNNRIRTLVPGKGLIVGAPWFWLALFFVLPFLFVLKISLAEPQLAQPPYQDWIREIEDGLITIKLNFGNYAMLWEDELYRDALWGSFEIAAISTFFCLLIGYPMAYAIALSPTHWTCACGSANGAQRFTAMLAKARRLAAGTELASSTV